MLLLVVLEISTLQQIKYFFGALGGLLVCDVNRNIIDVNGGGM